MMKHNRKLNVVLSQFCLGPMKLRFQYLWPASSHQNNEQIICKTIQMMIAWKYKATILCMGSVQFIRSEASHPPTSLQGEDPNQVERGPRPQEDAVRHLCPGWSLGALFVLRKAQSMKYIVCIAEWALRCRKSNDNRTDWTVYIYTTHLK